MAARKGRIIIAKNIRTGDTVMPPSVRESRLVLQAHNDGESVTLRTTAGSMHMPSATPVRVHRPTRTENHDAPSVVFSAGG